jgi:hypothetical protein
MNEGVFGVIILGIAFLVSLGSLGVAPWDIMNRLTA